MWGCPPMHLGVGGAIKEPQVKNPPGIIQFAPPTSFLDTIADNPAPIGAGISDTGWYIAPLPGKIYAYTINGIIPHNPNISVGGRKYIYNMPVFCGVGIVSGSGPLGLYNFDFNLTGGFTSQPTSTFVGPPGLQGGHETFDTKSDTESEAIEFSKGDIIVCGVGPGNDGSNLDKWWPAESNFSITLYIKFESI
jgi:hypothetical protein